MVDSLFANDTFVPLFDVAANVGNDGSAVFAGLFENGA